MNPTTGQLLKAIDADDGCNSTQAIATQLREALQLKPGQELPNTTVARLLERLERSGIVERIPASTIRAIRWRRTAHPF